MADTVKVTVTDGWAVAHDGQQHHGGTVLTMDTATAEHWRANGWATLTTPSRARKRTAP